LRLGTGNVQNILKSLEPSSKILAITGHNNHTCDSVKVARSVIPSVNFPVKFQLVIYASSLLADEMKVADIRGSI